MSLKSLAAQADSDDSQSKQLVVVIDDDDSVLKALKVVLSKLFEVRTFTDPVAGAAAAARAEVAVLIVDLKMPIHDGFWVYRSVRGAGSKVPIIFNSAYQDAKPSSEIEADYKPFAYLQKNGNLSDFINTVKKAAASRG